MRAVVLCFCFVTIACSATKSSNDANIDGTGGANGSEGSGVGNVGGEDGSVSGSTGPRTDFTAPLTSASPMPNGPMRPFDLTLTCSDDSGACAKTYWEVENSGLGMAEYTGPIPLTVDATIRFYSEDAGKNKEAVRSLSYVLDASAPTLVSQSPAPSATGVGLHALISFRFNEPLQPASVVGQCLLTPAAVVSETYDSTTSTLYLVPLAPLSEGTEYQLTCAAGAFTDLAGNTFAGLIDTRFTTFAPPLDTTPPALVDLTPAPASTNVSITQAISLTFDEPIAAIVCTVNGQARSDLIISGAVAYLPAVGTPRRGEPVHVECSGVRDQTNNALAGAIEWSFTMEPPTKENVPSESFAMFEQPELLVGPSGESAAFWLSREATGTKLFFSTLDAGGWSTGRAIDSGLVEIASTNQASFFATTLDSARAALVLYRAGTSVRLARIDLAGPNVTPVVTDLITGSGAVPVELARRGPSDVVAFYRTTSQLSATTIDSVTGLVSTTLSTTLGQTSVTPCFAKARASDYVAACLNVVASATQVLVSTFDGASFSPAVAVQGPAAITGQVTGLALTATPAHDTLAVTWYDNSRKRLETRVQISGTWDPPLNLAPTWLDQGATAYPTFAQFVGVNGVVGPTHLAIAWMGSTADGHPYIRRYRGAWEATRTLGASSQPPRMCGTADAFSVVSTTEYDPSDLQKDGRLRAVMGTATGALGAEVALLARVGGSSRCTVDGEGMPTFSFVSNLGPAVARLDAATNTAEVTVLGTDATPRGAPSCRAGAGTTLACAYMAEHAVAVTRRAANGFWDLRHPELIYAPTAPGRRNVQALATNARGEGLFIVNTNDGLRQHTIAYYFDANETMSAHELSEEGGSGVDTYATRDGFAIRYVRFDGNIIERARNGQFSERLFFPIYNHPSWLEVEQDVVARGVLDNQTNERVVQVHDGSRYWPPLVHDANDVIAFPVIGPDESVHVLEYVISLDTSYEQTFDGTSWRAQSELTGVPFWETLKVAHSSTKTLIVLGEETFDTASTFLVLDENGFSAPVALTSDVKMMGNELIAADDIALLQWLNDDGDLMVRFFDGTTLAPAQNLGPSDAAIGLVVTGSEIALMSVNGTSTTVHRFGAAGLLSSRTLNDIPSGALALVHETPEPAVLFVRDGVIYVARVRDGAYVEVSYGPSTGSVAAVGGVVFDGYSFYR